MINENSINIDWFGAYGDGIHDDTCFFKTAIKYCKENNLKLSSKGKTYLITEDIEFNSCNVDFNGGTIKSEGKKITLYNDTNIWEYKGTDVTYFKNCILHDTNLVTESHAQIVENIECVEWHGSAITLNKARYLDNVIFSNDRSDPETVGVTINASDKQISRLQGKGCFTGVIINAPNTVIKDSQLWLSDKNRVNGTLDGSIFIRVKQGTGLMFENCISDTYQYAMYFDGNVINADVNNFQVINNNILYHDCTMYLINKYIPIIGDVLVRMTNFKRDNIKFDLVSPCKLNIRVIDGELEKPITIFEGDLHNYIIDQNGNSISDNVTFANASVVKINNSQMIIQLDITFTNPNLKDFRIDTSNMCGINRVKGYSYIVAEYLNEGQEHVSNATITKGTNQMIIIKARSDGYFKRVACSIIFNID